MDDIMETIYTINFFTEGYTFIGSAKRIGHLPRVGKILHLPKLAKRADGLTHFRLSEFCYQEEHGELQPHFMAYAISSEQARKEATPNTIVQPKISTTKKQDKKLLTLIKS